MKSALIAIALLLFLAGCGVDDREFNIQRLTSWHQEIFRTVVKELNQAKPNAGLSTSTGGVSSAYYGDTPGYNAIVRHRYDIRILNYKWVIIFKPEVAKWYSGGIKWLTAHELCHVLQYGHTTGNPDPGSCLPSE